MFVEGAVVNPKKKKDDGHVNQQIGVVLERILRERLQLSLDNLVKEHKQRLYACEDTKQRLLQVVAHSVGLLPKVLVLHHAIHEQRVQHQGHKYKKEVCAEDPTRHFAEFRFVDQNYEPD